MEESTESESARIMHRMNRRAYVPADTAWHLISLRPQGQHDTLRSAASRAGAHTVALSPWRLALRNDPLTRERLADAAQRDRLIFTSPAAAEATARMLPLSTLRAGTVVAVGEGTARILRKYGAINVQAPTRMDSEGLLALPCMQSLHGLRVALITAPGGRGMIAAQVCERGAELLRVDVYERVPLPISAASIARLQALTGPTVLAVSSGEALETVLPQLPPALLQRWQQTPVVTASARLTALAQALGFQHVSTAAGPLPAQMVEAASAAVHPSPR
jgi:uroporphyrinogen-III synthase